MHDHVTIDLTPEMREQLDWLAAHRERSRLELARELFAEELEAQVGLSRGPYLRRFMYRS